MKTIRLLFVMFMCVYSLGLSGQEECLTELTQGQADFMNETRDARDSFDGFDSNDEHVIPIQFHILKNGNNFGADINELQTELEGVNDLYASMNMTFVECDNVNYIDNSNWFNGFGYRSSAEFAMANANNVEGKLNIYYGPNMPGSYASFPFSLFEDAPVDWIIITEGASNNGGTLKHEIGHYFNLYHTHQNESTYVNVWELEHPDGSNCGPNVGDELCDTEADPRLSSRVNSNCVYAPNSNDNNYASYKIDDLELSDYDPNPENVMSYTQKHCRTYFSPKQQERILKSLLCDRFYLNCDNIAVPDLMVTACSSNKTELDAGSSVYVTSTVENVGGAPTGDNSYLGYYLSDDPIFQVGQDYNFSDDYVNPLNANATDSESQNLQIPSNTASGKWYILFVADHEEDIAEANESNNVKSICITVTSSSNGPDLIIDEMTIATTTACPSDYVYVTADVKNIGNQVAIRNTRLKYYLSTNETYGGGDVYLRRDYVDKLYPNDIDSENTTVKIPSNTSPGSYYILFRADATSICSESNEGNNVGAMPIYVGACKSVDEKSIVSIEENNASLMATPSFFSDFTEINFDISEKSTISLNIFDISGRKVAELINNEEKNAGSHFIKFTPKNDLSNGIYFCQLTIGDHKETIKIMLQR